MAAFQDQCLRTKTEITISVALTFTTQVSPPQLRPDRYIYIHSMIEQDLAIEFNNLGVALLNEQDNRREAISLFKGASQIMMHLISEAGPNDKHKFDDALYDKRVLNARRIYQRRTNEVHLGDAPFRTSAMLLEGSDVESFTCKSFMCKRAISVVKEHLPSDWTQLITMCCSVILYNIALVYHLNALDSVLESSGQTALNLYEMSFTLLSGEPLNLSSSTLIGRVIMYTLNNMASLNHELTHWELSAECMKRLTIIATLMQARDIGGLLRAECHSFLLNAMVLKAPTRAPAA
jgi:hypothetical protein